MSTAQRFIDLLLASGGDTVIGYENDSDVPKLLKRGIFLKPDEVRLMLGEPNRCHSNACELSDLNPGMELHTGWALSADGIWRPHTWGYWSGVNQIIETTSLRTLYFGMRLTGKELNTFKENNWY
jgi:hypothetical protein